MNKSKIYKCEYPQMVCRYDVEGICDDIGCKFKDIDLNETYVDGFNLVIVLKNGDKYYSKPNLKSAVEEMIEDGPYEYGWEDDTVDCS